MKGARKPHPMARKFTRAHEDAHRDMTFDRPGHRAAISGDGHSVRARPDGPRRARAEVEFDEQTVLGALFGQFDTNLVQIENRLGVFISARGNKVLIEGPEDAVARARDVLKGLYQRL